LEYKYQPKRILLIQFGSVAEVVQSLPVLNALRLRYPLAEIAFLLESGMTSLLTRHPALDRLIFAKSNWYKSLEQMKLLKKRLHAFTPDLCFELEGTLRGALAAWMSGAKHRVGFSRKNSVHASWLLNNIRHISVKTHPLDRKLELLEEVGIVGTSINYDLPSVPHENEAAVKICRSFDLQDTPFLLVHASEGIPDTNLWRQIIDYLLAKWNIPTLLMYQNDAEQRLAEDLAHNISGAVGVLPKLSLSLTAALMRRPLFFLSASTDSLYLASATGLPCVGLLDSPKTFPPINDRLSHWIKLSMSPVTDIFDACDILLEEQLPREFSDQKAAEK
jgi:ADP-heptose:LPS heptosyltransferase